MTMMMCRIDVSRIATTWRIRTDSGRRVNSVFSNDTQLIIINYS